MVIFFLLWAGPAFGLDLTEHPASWDEPHSPYKIGPGMAENLQALTAPIVMDQDLEGGWHYAGIRIDRFMATYVLEREGAEVLIHLLPPDYDRGEQTPSFRIVLEGQPQDAPAVLAMMGRIRANDGGGFWPEPGASVTRDMGALEETPASPEITGNSVHYSHVLGDLALLILVVLVLFAAVPLFRVLPRRPALWWGGLAAVLLAGLSLRLMFFSEWTGTEPLATGTALDPQLSPSWFLYALSRYRLMTLRFVAMSGLALSLLSVVGLAWLMGLLGLGAWASLAAAMALATWPADVIMAGAVGPMVGLHACLLWSLVCLAAAGRLEPGATPFADRLSLPLLSAFLLGLGLFIRPEALILLPAWLAAWGLWSGPGWLRRPETWISLAALVLFLILRLVGLVGTEWPPSPVLDAGFSLLALGENLLAWVLSWRWAPLPALVLWGVGLVACRPWRDHRRTLWVMGLWLLPVLLFYYRASYDDGFTGGRILPLLGAPLAWLTALAIQWIDGLPEPRRRFFLVGVFLLLAAAPLVLHKTLGLGLNAVYSIDFLKEV